MKLIMKYLRFTIEIDPEDKYWKEFDAKWYFRTGGDVSGENALIQELVNLLHNNMIAADIYVDGKCVKKFKP